MLKLPIAICLFTSTKGHFGHRDMYLDTIRHLDRQIPLLSFGSLYAHVKITPGEEGLADQIETNLVAKGFHVEKTIGEWKRGQSHGHAYLGDMAKASQSSVIQSQPYMLLLEDDSTLSPNQDNLLYWLSRMTRALQADHNLVSTRLIRRCDYDGGVPMANIQHDHFYSPHFDFQPAILRSRDYLLANKVIQDNWAAVSHLQCELVMRMALDTLSRGEHRHLVFKPDAIETYHLGTPAYEDTKRLIGLT